MLTPTSNSFNEKLLETFASLKDITFPVHKRSHQTPQWNKKLQYIVGNAIEKINQNPNLETSFAIAAETEKALTSLINEVLHGVNQKQSLKQLSPKLDCLGQINAHLKQMNLSMASHINQVIEEGVQNNPENPHWKNMEIFSKKVKTDTSILANTFQATSIEKIDAITDMARNLTLSAVLKEINHEKGQQLLSQLSEHNTFDIDVTPTITFSPESMAVSPNSLNGYAKIDKATCTTELNLNQREQEIKPNSGAGSVITVPIIMPESHMENMQGYLLQTEDVIEKSCSAFLDGSITTAQDGISFMPFQVELIHELIHVAHNTQGENLRNIPLSESEKKQWSTYEEHHTIHSGEINEADFSQHYGAYPRTTHSAQASQTLFIDNQREKKTTLAAIVKKQDHQEETCLHHGHSIKDRLKQLIKSAKDEEVSDTQQMKIK